MTNSGRLEDAITLAQLRAIVAVGRMGSFTQAGKVLGISQSAVSRVVANLENELGAVLLDRTTRRVALTKSGEVLVRHATDVLAKMDLAAEAVREVEDSAVSTLSFACAASIGTSYLAQTLRRFEERYPDVQITCYERGHPFIETAVASGEADFGVINIAELHPSLESRALWTERYHLCLRRDHPLAGHDIVNINEIQDDIFVTLPAQLGQYIAGDLVKAAKGRAHVPRLRVDQHLTAFRLVEAGQGVLILPASSVVDLPDTLAAPALGGESLNRVVGAIWRRGAALSMHAEEFIKDLIAVREEKSGSGQVPR